jgi:hypothetical protein
MSILACKLNLLAKVLILFDLASHFSFIKNATVMTLSAFFRLVVLQSGSYNVAESEYQVFARLDAFQQIARASFRCVYIIIGFP